MTDVMREMIAQLMGQQRAEEEGRKLPPFDHHSVCRSYLLGCCPRDLLSDTRLESLMICRKMHEPAHKGEYNKAQEKKDLFYDVEAFEELEDAIRSVDHEIRRLQEKVKRDAEQNMDINEQQRTQKIFELNEQIGTALVQVEALGNEGRINESIELSKKVDELKKKKRELDSEMKTSNPSTVVQRLRVCEACSAQLNIMDHESRLQDHYGGKMHLGMVEIRERYDDLKKTIEERKAEKKKAEEKERGDRRRERGKSKSRERSRSRERKRRSRSRSRSRSRKDRRRSRSRDRKSSRRDSSRERRRH